MRHTELKHHSRWTDRSSMVNVVTSDRYSPSYEQAGTIAPEICTSEVQIE